jgi:hypothetical protein
MALAGVILQRLMGLLTYFDPNYNSNYYGPPGVPIEIDGILMPYGWWLTARDSLIFILCGFATTLIVRGVVGPGRAPVGGETEIS